jgi:hypothetical protein
MSFSSIEFFDELLIIGIQFIFNLAFNFLELNVLFVDNGLFQST